MSRKSQNRDSSSSRDQSSVDQMAGTLASDAESILSDQSSATEGTLEGSSSLGGTSQSSSAGATLTSLTQNINQEQLSKMGQDLSRRAQELRSRATDLDQKLRTDMRNRPWVYVGSAAGVGFVLGSNWGKWIARTLMLIGLRDVIRQAPNFKNFLAQKREQQASAA